MPGLTIDLSKIPDVINFVSGQISPRGHFDVTINTPTKDKNEDNKKRKNTEDLKDVEKKLKFYK